MEEKVRAWINDNGIPEYCNYCIDDWECPKGVVCYGGEPIEPWCCNWDDPANYLDTEAIAKDIKNGEITI